MSLQAVINEQDRLLTVNIKDGEIKNALPGVHVTPLFLDTQGRLGSPRAL